MTPAHQVSVPAAPDRPDWQRAAELLARGDSVASIAREIGCSRSQLSRKRNHDPSFQSWIEYFQQVETDSGDDLCLQESVHRAIENEIRIGNVRVVLWLAQRLSLVTPPDERTPAQELQEILDSLSTDELIEFQSLRD